MIDAGKVFSLHETIHDRDYLLATYYIELDRDTEIIGKARMMAVGQTVGTWIPVPGVTEEMQDKHMGRVVGILDAPPHELSSGLDAPKCAYFIQIAYPTINFEDNLPMIVTTLLGNDASTSAQVKLMDIQMPTGFASRFAGPRYGVEGIRELTGVRERPFILNMIKPCTGFSPAVGAKIFYETALGGVDFIKDDELLGNPGFCPAVERVKAYNEAARAAYERTGHKTRYVVNVTERADRLLDHAKRVVEAGAEMVMVNFAAVGYDMLRALTDAVGVPVLGHYAGSGMFYEGTSSGMSSPLAVGKLPRLAGADMVMINSPYGGYPLRPLKYIRTAMELSLPYYHIRPALTAVGGGVHPGMAQRLIWDLGRDVVLSPGGSIQGHPKGAAAGGRAMRQAVDAVMRGIPVKEAAREHEELAAALALWGELE